MRLALVNPCWDFEGSVYFGCREPHLPLEYGYAKVLLEAEGHRVAIIDGQIEALSRREVAERVAAFAPDATVVTTAPSYLFWRCAPPELRVPMATVADLRRVGGILVVVGPHASTTPAATLRKLGADVAVLGECEEVLVALARALDAGGAADIGTALRDVAHIAVRADGEVRVQGGPHAAGVASLPALRWPDAIIGRHAHHHHRFDVPPAGPGAEMEVSRGCPYHCTFCAKDNFRNAYRRRPLEVLLAELDGLIAQGVRYVYFIDEIFLPWPALLQALVERRQTADWRFGIQTRIDLWKPGGLELLGQAGCVSIEAGVESITPEGRNLLDKRCKLSTEELADLLAIAKRHVPFVQANLLDAGTDDPTAIEAWREGLRARGVWANKPVPLFPYPGSPDYVKRWGLPDDLAWERAHADYLQSAREFSDIQDGEPLPLPVLEGAGAGR
jgi:anaerobic magnesium-protoporphyrin IX monomethyl ester cyclase